MQTLGEILFDARLRRQLSIRAAAKRVGMSHSSLADHENDAVRDVTVSNLDLFAKGYRLSMVRLVTAALENGRKKR